MTIGNGNFTYKSYLQSLQDANHVVDAGYIQQLLLQYRQLSALSIVLPNAPILFAIDYSKGQYLFFSNALGNYSAQQVLEGGLEFTLPLMPNDFYNTYNQKVFQAVLLFLKTIPQQQHIDYIISCNHRILNSDKKDIDILQRCTYITSAETGLPTHCIGMALDISHFKNDNTINLSFEKTNKDTGLITLIEKQYFYPYQEEGFLTQQENTILQYLADGLNSKMIAQKLALSLKTIESHRYNMFRKTNTKNVVGLVMYAVKNRML